MSQIVYWIPLVVTSPSGKLQFMCRSCGRISPLPDKSCSGVTMPVNGEGDPKNYAHRKLVELPCGRKAYVPNIHVLNNCRVDVTVHPFEPAPKIAS